MMNFIGKGLVLIYTIFCLLALMLALVVYFDFIDWGRAEPRVAHGEATKGSAGGNDMRIASEYEKSKVIFDNAVAGRNLVVSPLEPAEAALRAAQRAFGKNHLYYVAELDKLRHAPDDIKVMRLPPDGIPTDTPGKAIGKAIPSVQVPELDKSIDRYSDMLKMEQAKIRPIEVAIGGDPKTNQEGLTKKNSDLSYQLTGKNEEGKKIAHGLFDLVDAEFRAQQRLFEEYERLQPYWANAVEEARRYNARRTSLEETLSGLDKALKARQAKQK